MDRRCALAASLTLFFNGTGTYRPKKAFALVSVRLLAAVGVVVSVVVMVELVRRIDHCVCFHSLQIFFCRNGRFISGFAEMPVVVSEEADQERSPIQIGSLSVVGCGFHRLFLMNIANLMMIAQSDRLAINMNAASVKISFLFIPRTRNHLGQAHTRR